MCKAMLLVGVFTIAYGWTDALRDHLTNDDVIELIQGGFSPSVVLQAVRTNDSRFDVSPKAAARLQTAGVDGAIVGAMAAAGNKQATQLRILDPGVYFRGKDAYDLLRRETANWQGTQAPAGGRLTRILVTGIVDGETSFLRLSASSELLIVCAPDESPAEYQLLRAEVRNETRRFVAEAALRGTAVLGIGALDKNVLPVETDTTFDLGVRWFLTRIPKGEYALVRRDLMAGGSVQPTAAIYTFTLE